ncbi:hypothetical protein HPB52_011864 [Rhipicephalus sanguineus]|uniref:Transposase Tc1-like domain-containing protein n=1 Tax=Rhipicephalus sanguineus TaxID=34632 RepID=A0A9D4PZG6_RHISA|nr:hypothetical protein HPB52_011864 [Rhipicephalus sanguineus]
MLGLDAPLAQGEAKRRLQHDVTDAFKMFRNFPVAIAMFDTDKDGDLDCLATVRSNFDEEGHKATYTWLLPGLNGHEKKNITFDLREGASPDKPIYTPEDGDGSDKVANFIYSDNKQCTVLEIPYKNELQCILWVNPKIVKDVPQHCLDYYEDNCDMPNPAYDDETSPAIREDLDLDVSDTTVRRHLRTAGLRSRVAAQKPVLTAANKDARRQFAELHEAWTSEEWGRVIFSDESSF